ncbi:MAG: hypothetical protein JST29_03315 [Bacteroidetes bacterium]|nr:hypothetical protein [Bacteroidota bacterium]
MKKICCTIFLVLIIFPAFSQMQEALLIKKAKAFYAWYNSKNNKMPNFNLYKGKNAKFEPPYYIDWNTVNKYFAYIKNNVPWLGETFIKNEKAFFKTCDEYFKKYPDDEIPYGFDYERIVGGQVGIEEAVEIYLPKTGKWKAVIQGNIAYVYCIYKTIDYETDKPKEAKSITEFRKENGVFKIAKTIGMTEIEETDPVEVKEG